jgi:hypothetical protein
LISGSSSGAPERLFQKKIKYNNYIIKLILIYLFTKHYYFTKNTVIRIRCPMYCNYIYLKKKDNLQCFRNCLSHFSKSLSVKICHFMYTLYYKISTFPTLNQKIESSNHGNTVSKKKKKTLNGTECTWVCANYWEKKDLLVLLKATFTFIWYCFIFTIVLTIKKIEVWSKPLKKLDEKEDELKKKDG